jgi:Trk K+ transport system NAD-binding subunit
VAGLDLMVGGLSQKKVLVIGCGAVGRSAVLAALQRGADVSVIDSDRRLILMNRKARDAFEVTDENLTGKRARDTIQHPELIDFLRGANMSSSSRVELGLKDGRVMNTQITPIPEIGLVVTMQDITYLKDEDVTPALSIRQPR